MRFPFATNLKSRDGALTKDAKCKNYIIDVDGEGNPVRASKRPGLTDLVLLRAGTAQLLTYWNGIVAILGDYLFQASGCSFYTSPELPGLSTTFSASTTTIFPGDIAISSDGLFVYVSNTSLDTISQFSRSLTSGILTPLTPATVASGDSPSSIQLSPNNAHLYAINRGAPNDISQFSRNSSTGLLTALSPAAVSAVIDQSLAFSPNGLSMYAIYGFANKILQFSRNNTTGQVAALTPATITDTAGLYAIAVSPDGLNAYTANNTGGVSGSVSQYSRNTTTGALTILSPATIATSGPAVHLVISPDGLFVYTADQTSDAISQFSRNASTGLLTALSPAAVAAGLAYRLAIKADGTALYETTADNTIKQYRRNVTTGLLTALSPTTITTGGIGIQVIQMSPDGLFAYVSDFAGDKVLMFTAVPAGVALLPSSANLPFTAQDNGSNAGTQYLMFKNAVQAWTMTNATGALPTLITDADYPGTYAVTATSLTRSGTVATVTTPSDTNFQVGGSVVISGATPSGYNGTKTITGITASSVTTIGPVGVTVARVGTTATATSVEPHGFSTGMSITISGATQTEYNGTFAITWISATTFSFTIAVTGSALPATPATGAPSILFGGVYTVGANTAAAPTIFTTFNPGGFNFVNGDTVTIQAINPLLNGSYVITVAGLNITFTIPGITSLATLQGSMRISTTPTITSITRSGSTATVTTSAPHRYLGGFNTNGGSQLAITGATEFQYNIVTAGIVPTSSTTFTYELTQVQSPATPATGTISAAYNLTIGASFTFAIAGSPATPATGTIVVAGGRNTVPGIAYLNGRFAVMDIYGVIYTSREDDPTAWDALDYITAQNETGAGVYLGKSQSYIVAYKQWSTEFFYDAQNPVGSPLSPVDNGFTQVGCASGGSVALLGDTTLWISQSKNIKGRTVHKMVGTTQTKVSTPDIERILNIALLTTVYAFGIKLEGSSLYILTLATSNLTLVYDLDSNVWSQWSSLTLAASKSVSSITLSGTTATVTTSTAHGMADGDPVNISGATQAGYNGIRQITYVSTTVFTVQVAAGLTTPATGTILAFPYTESYYKFTKYTSCTDDDLLLHESDGHLYEMLSSIYRDAGIPIVGFTRSGRMDGGTTALKPMPRLILIADKVSDTIMVRWSDDDCATFTTYRPMNMAYEQPVLRRSKEFRRRSIETTFIGNNPIVCTSLENETE